MRRRFPVPPSRSPKCAPLKLEAGQPLERVHARTNLRQRTIELDQALLADAPEFVRITVHEIFHFVWRRLDNATRLSWQQMLEGEVRQRVPGELGWSAEWRKAKIIKDGGPARRWRDYACESFCDTAAWYFSPRRTHPEFTLGRGARSIRKRWFDHLLATRALPL